MSWRSNSEAVELLRCGHGLIRKGQSICLLRIMCMVKVLPLAGDFGVGVVHRPTLANRVLAPTKYGGQHRHPLDCPAMHSSVVNDNTTFPHHVLNMAQAERVGCVPAHARQHHFEGIVKPFEDLVQGAVD